MAKKKKNLKSRRRLILNQEEEEESEAMSHLPHHLTWSVLPSSEYPHVIDWKAACDQVGWAGGPQAIAYYTIT